MSLKEIIMDTDEIILYVEHNITWLPQPNEGQIVLSTIAPTPEVISTAMVFAFSGDAMLQTHLRARGWDIPGGHIERGETPEEAAHREVYEETCAHIGPLHLIGFQRLLMYGPKPEGYPYSYPISYQLFYWAHVTQLYDFVPTSEAVDRKLFSPAEAIHARWVQKHIKLYQAALQAATLS